jgi:hypothetical protein
MENPASQNLLFTSAQINLINLLLPSRYFAGQVEVKPVQRKNDLEPVFPALPEKRAKRDKEPDVLTGKSEAFKKCFKTLTALKKNSLSKRFLTQSENKEPDEVDLQVVENRLVSGEYLSAFHLTKDVRKMISIHFLRTCRSPELYLEIHEFSILFESLFKGSESLVFSENIVQDLSKKVEKLSAGIKEIQHQILTPRPKDKKMTPVEKKMLCSSLKKLDPKYLAGVLKIVKGSLTNTGEELEFDLEKLPNKVCRELDRYIKQCLQFKPKKPAEGQKTMQSNPVTSKSQMKSESEESSSSSSQSEEELPGAPFELLERDLQDLMTEKF